MIKKVKIAFLLDLKNIWIKKYLTTSRLLKNKKFNSKIFTDYKKIKNFDIVFILNYTKILDNSFLRKNNLNIVVHASNLPNGKGFSPMQWQILSNKNKIPICLFKAVSKVDAGEIYEKAFIISPIDKYSKELNKIVKHSPWYLPYENNFNNFFAIRKSRNSSKHCN